MRYSRQLAALAFSFVILLSGCESTLDVEPSVSIDSEVALQGPDDVENALVGAYSLVKRNTVYAHYNNMVGELLANSEELIFTGTFQDFLDMFNKAQVPSNVFSTAMWLDAYEAINSANVVITNIDLIEAGTERDRILGEARFIRGITYLYLARYFAPPWNSGDPSALLGLPLRLQPTSRVSEELFLSRSSLADTYGQIIDDLESAVSLLPETPADRGRATTYAATAFLSEVYLEQTRYQEAGQAANRVITESPHTLVESYSAAFNNATDSSEDIFAIQQTATDPAGGCLAFYASLPGNIGRADMDISDAHLALYEDGDDRLALFYPGTGLFPGIIRTGKWKSQFTSVPIIRLSEMYLTRAEANFRTGGGIGPNTPLQDVNVIRERASLAPLTSVTLDDILFERHLELAWEGHSLRDLKRTEGSVTRFGTVFAFDDPHLVLPIPQREIDIHAELQQNPGY